MLSSGNDGPKEHNTNSTDVEFKVNVVQNDTKLLVIGIRAGL